MKNILIISNSLKSVFRFRMWMIARMAENGYKIVVAAPFEGISPVDTGSIIYVNFDVERKSISLFSNLILMYKFFKISKIRKFDIAICYTVKPALFFPFIFFMSKTKVISILTGLGSGYLKIKNSKLLLQMAGFALNLSNLVVVLNASDKNVLVNRVGITSSKVFILPGEGVDLDFFKYSCPVQKSKINFLFIGRLIKDKGIFELIYASKKLHDIYNKDFSLTIIGDIDSGNPESLSLSEVVSFSNLNYIEYVRETNHIEKYIEKSDVFVLPSYREGLSRSLLESCAIGRACIVSDAAGMLELVDHGVNGLVVESGDKELLAVSMLNFINMNYEDIILMGRKSAARLKGKYDLDHVYAEFEQVIKRTD
ncbi:glycosyltransferase family 4 protein [Oceanospirillaceae bacterium]|nr:glycosyltransferase family 4 protein [Oceanospirillaceae bacterium]